MRRDFCTKCGASFPPRYGEGTCREWEKCRDAQWKRERTIWDDLNNALFKLAAGLFLAAFILITVAECSNQAHGAQPPHESLKYRDDLIRNARVIGGLGAPIALFAGQIQQESAWRPNVSSKYAHGLAQFTPDTSEWISGMFPELRENQPFNPSWALRALVRYDYWLKERIRGDVNCDRWAMVLSAYNGGLGWLLRDKNLAKRNGFDPYLWWGHVERYSSRADWAFKENRHYPRAIIQRHQNRYAGWGATVPCDIERIREVGELM